MAGPNLNVREAENWMDDVAYESNGLHALLQLSWCGQDEAIDSFTCLPDEIDRFCAEMSEGSEYIERSADEDVCDSINQLGIWVAELLVEA